MGACTSQTILICINCKQIVFSKSNNLHKCRIKVSLKTQHGYTIIPKGKNKREQITKLASKFSSYKLGEINQFNYQKTPIEGENICYKSIFVKMYRIKPTIVQLSPIQMKFAPFQMKLTWFRMKLQQYRISWDKGCDTIIIDRQNILFSGIEALSKTNLHRQIKIKFLGEQNVFDAGGLLRQWMHLSIKEIFNKDLSLFVLCNSQQTAYKFATNFQLQLASKAVQVLGQIIGKAIFEKIPLGCFLNYATVRSICGEKVRLEDTFNFDKELYSSWLWILKNKNVHQLQKYFVEENPYGNGEDVELVPEGKQKKLTDQNKNQYLIQSIDFYCYHIGEYLLEKLKSAIYKTIPQQLLYVFEPHQFDAILNGPSQVDIKDWKKNTEYDGYDSRDQIINNFWSLIEGFDDQRLRNLLHYCTGITRVPIHGFSHLQSNRGQIRKFTIRKVDYVKDANMFPKAYTCFNRLQLPNYPTQQQLQEKILSISNQEISYFGLD